MGAAASMKLAYSGALEWFKLYFDEMTYADDFHTLDKNGDGGISYDEIDAWLKCKSSSGPSWKIVINNRSVFKSAHKFASVHRDKHAASVRDSDRIFGLEAFKLFLIHLFVLSILWVHFEHADEWEEGHDTGNRCLNLDEFKMACRTFMHSHANEEVDNEKIAADFNMLDTDGSGAVDFSEVCTYCSKFVDASFASSFPTSATPASALGSFSEPVAADTSVSPTRVQSAASSASSKAAVVAGAQPEQAVGAIAQELDKSRNIAHFEEIKAHTEVLLGVF